MFNNNKIENSASNMFVFSQYAIIVGNKSKCTMTSSTPTGAVIANNVVDSNMSSILTDEEYKRGVKKNGYEQILCGKWKSSVEHI